jgi:hypothetical protein
MREYKREKAMLEIQVAELEKKSGYHDDHLRIVDAWWNQVCTHLHVMCRSRLTHATQLIDEVKTFANDLSTPTQPSGTHSTLPQFPLLSSRLEQPP